MIEKKINTPGSTTADENVKLHQENEILAQQVKRLIKVESKLYDYQEKLDAQLKEYKNLYELSKKLNAASDPRKVFKQAVEYVIQNLEYERVLFFEQFENKGSYSVCAIDGYYDPMEKKGVSELTIKQEDPLLAPLLAGVEYIICKTDSEEKSRSEYRTKLLMDEYLIYRLGHRAQPLALLVVGNSATNAEFYRKVTDSDGALVGIGNLVGLMSSTIETLVDISERKKAEENLLNAHSRINQLLRFNEALLSAVPTAIFYKDKNGRYLGCNNAFSEIMGVTSYQIKGKTVQELWPSEYAEMYHKKDLEMISAPVKQVYEFKVRDKNGQDRPVIYAKDVFRDENGNVAGIVGAFQDITERKRAEETLRRMNEELETRVRERTRQLQVEIEEHKQAELEKAALREQLLHSQKMEAVGTLVGGIAHEFNNILMVLIGYSTLLQDKMRPGDPLIAHVNQINTASERAANLTRGLLAFSRKQVMDLKPCQVNEIIRSMKSLLERTLSEEIELKMLLSDDNMIILADRIQMGQVLLNLATNARDAMPKGGTLTIETYLLAIDKAFIQASGIGEKGRYAVISVSDTGCGMDDATQQKIFEPFFTTKEVGKGTGLGLSIVYGIINQHKGFITLSSEPGKGTTVHIYIPAVHADAEGAVSPLISEKKESAGTILVAEDHEDLRKFIKELLENEGYVVITAINGEDAVRKYKENNENITLLLFDVVMPKKNGVDAYLEIRKIKQNMKVLFMSGYTGDVVFDKGIQDASFHFVSKPLTPNVLLQKVREILGGQTQS